MTQVSGSDIAEFLGVEAVGCGNAVVRGVAGFATADAHSLLFAADAEALTIALRTPAPLILSFAGSSEDYRVLPVRDPKTAFARVYARWFDTRGLRGVHGSAVVEEGAILGAGCEIGAFSLVESGARLGEHCVLGPGVVVRAGCVLGDRVQVQTGAVLGSDGFGYVSLGGGHLGFPQVGGLVIGDDVEIGANTTVDRGHWG